MIEIRALRDTPDDVELGLGLVREYVVATAEEVGQDVDVILSIVPDLQDFAGRYFRGGAFLVASDDGAPAGAVGVTPADDGVCEMNRLWVREPYRRRGLGRELSVASMDAARALGFRRMHLDVVPARHGAIALYRGLGFVETPPVHTYPFEMVFLGRDL